MINVARCAYIAIGLLRFTNTLKYLFNASTMTHIIFEFSQKSSAVGYNSNGIAINLQLYQHKKKVNFYFSETFFSRTRCFWY